MTKARRILQEVITAPRSARAQRIAGMRSLRELTRSDFDDGAIELLTLIMTREPDNEVARAAIDLAREVSLAPGPRSVARVGCALSRTVQSGDPARSLLYTWAISTLPWQWNSISNSLETMLNRLRTQKEPDPKLFAGLATAYMAAAPDIAVTYIGEQLLSNHPYVNAASGTLGTVAANPKHVDDPAREVPLLANDARLAIATAMLNDTKHVDMRFDLIKPALGLAQNSFFVTDRSFTNALLNKNARRRAVRAALHLHMFGSYIINEALGHHDERAARAAAYAKEYTMVLRTYGSQLDAATLTELQTDGQRFNTWTPVLSTAVPIDEAAALALQAKLGPLWTIAHFIVRTPIVWNIAIVPVGWIAWLVLLRTAPLLILRNERGFVAIRDADLPFISAAVKAGFYVSQIHGSIVQDRWIREALRSEFTDPIVELSEGIVPIPVQFRTDDMQDFTKAVPALYRDQLHDFASRGRLRLLIMGEGGSGKTTLASYAGSLAQHEDPDVRIFTRRAFVVALTAEIDPSVTTVDAVLDEICARLRSIQRLSHADAAQPQAQTYLESVIPVYRPLVEDMLAEGRLLLILDGVSEMPKGALSAIRSFLSQKAVRYVIATSRSETALGSRFGTVVRPLRIAGEEHLVRFVNDYRETRGLRIYQSSAEIAKGLARVSNSKATPLLIWLYLKLLPERDPRETGDLTVGLNVLDLMEEYVRWLNAKISQPDRMTTDAVLSTARTIAMLCCIESRTFSSSSVDYGSARKYLASVDGSPGDRIDYFVESLTLLRRVGKGEDRVRFAIDSLSEYLAGSYVTRLCRKDYDSAIMLLSHDDEMEQILALMDFSTRITECVTAELQSGDLVLREKRSLSRLSTALEELRSQLIDLVAKRTPA